MSDIKAIQLILQGRNDSDPAFKQLQGSLDKSRESASALSSVLSTVIGPLAGAMAVREIVNTAVAWQGYNNALTAITGSAEGARNELQFIREISDKLGLDLSKTTESWVQFAAATKGSAVEGAEAKRIFETFQGTFQVLGVDADRAKLGMLALQQMLSKGKVSSEELRQQLGEQLPGAFRIFAQAAGVSEAQLGKLLKDGDVLAADILPKVADKLLEMYGPGFQAASASALASINRFNTALTDIKLELANAGVMDVFVGVLKSLSQALGDDRTVEAIRNMGASMENMATGSGPALVSALEGIIKVFQALGIGGQVVMTTLQLIGDTLAAVSAAMVEAAQGNFKTAWNILQDPTPGDNFRKNMDLLEKSTRGFWGEADKAAEQTTKFNEATKETSVQVKAAADSLEEEKQKLLESREAKIRKIQAQLELTGATSDYARKVAEQRVAEQEASKVKELLTGKTEKQRESVEKLAVEMAKIASTYRTKQLELWVGFNTEQLKADTEIIKSTISSVGETIKNTGESLFGEHGLMKDFLKVSKGGSWSSQRFVEDQIKKESERRDKALDQQNKLVKAQTDFMELRNESMRNGGALINITADGLEPELEAFMFKIIERVQMRVTESAADFLLVTV